MQPDDKQETTMDLILWRHAEAEDGDGRTPDAKRRLTARGEKQARKMAARPPGGASALRHRGRLGRQEGRDLVVLPARAGGRRSDRAAGGDGTRLAVGILPTA